MQEKKVKPEKKMRQKHQKKVLQNQDSPYPCTATAYGIRIVRLIRTGARITTNINVQSIIPPHIPTTLT